MKTWTETPTLATMLAAPLLTAAILGCSDAMPVETIHDDRIEAVLEIVENRRLAIHTSSTDPETGREISKTESRKLHPVLDREYILEIADEHGLNAGQSGILLDRIIAARHHDDRQRGDANK